MNSQSSDEDMPLFKAGGNDSDDQQEENHEDDYQWNLFNNPRATLPPQRQFQALPEETEIRMHKDMLPGQNPPFPNPQHHNNDSMMSSGREDEDEDFMVDGGEGEDNGKDEDVDMAGRDEAGRNEVGDDVMETEEPDSTAANNQKKPPTKRSNGRGPNAMIDEESTVKTRARRNKQITWRQDNECSRIARAPVYRVGVVHGEPSQSPYAPIIDMTASGANASLYVMLSWADVEDMFSWWIYGDEATHNTLQGVLKMNPKFYWPKKPLFAKDQSVWVPLAFLHALADQAAPWVPVANLRDDAATNLHNTIYKVKKEDKLFPTRTNKNTKNAKNAKPFKKVSEENLWVPLRDSLGRLILCKHTGTWDTPKNANSIKLEWRRALESLLAPSCSNGSSAARYQTVEVGELLIKIMPLGYQRFTGRRGGAQNVFNHLIDEINKGETRNGGKAKLLEKDKQPSNDYQFLSEHPFGLYQTFILKASHDKYMKQLLAGCFKTAAEELAVYEKSTEIDPKTRKSKGIVDPRGIPKDIEELIRRLKPIDKDMKKRAEKPKDARADGRSAIKKGDKRAKVKEPSVGDIQTKTYVNLSAEKCQIARGARKTEKATQGVVMGESASKRCIDYFGWKWVTPSDRAANWPTIPPKDPAIPPRTTPFRVNEMYNGLFIAEWLHLSAYSWGGIADPRNTGVSIESLASSSQVPENLVIGTSETNSAMTRWEKAWQKLIKAEGEIFTILGEEEKGLQYGGLLTITRHPFATHKPILSDPKNRIGPYSRADCYASYLHDVAVATPGDPDTPFKYVVKWMAMTPELQELTKQYRWICFQFDYDIKLRGKSEILKLDMGSVMGRNRFYPFRRMLFHKIEHDLDSALWKDMRMEGVEGIKCQYADGQVTHVQVGGRT